MISVPRGSGTVTPSDTWRCGRFLRVFGDPGDSEVLKGLSGCTGGIDGTVKGLSVPTGSTLSNCPSVGRLDGEVAWVHFGSTLSSLACVSSNCSSRLVRSGASIPESAVALCSPQTNCRGGDGSSGEDKLLSSSSDVSFSGVGG